MGVSIHGPQNGWFIRKILLYKMMANWWFGHVKCGLSLTQKYPKVILFQKSGTVDGPVIVVWICPTYGLFTTCYLWCKPSGDLAHELQYDLVLLFRVVSTVRNLFIDCYNRWETHKLHPWSITPTLPSFTGENDDNPSISINSRKYPIFRETRLVQRNLFWGGSADSPSFLVRPSFEFGFWCGKSILPKPYG